MIKRILLGHKNFSNTFCHYSYDVINLDDVIKFKIADVIENE